MLVTGFEPFRKENSNPTERLARAFEGRSIGESMVTGRVLPVSYRRVGTSLRLILKKEKPEVVVATGLWGGRTDVTVERVAVNIMDARIPDNDGFSPKDSKVVKGGPAAYFSTFPYTRIVADMRRDEVPATLSYSAGTFICNALLYHLLHYAHRHGIPKLGGFLHVPNLPTDVVSKEGAFGMSKPSMSFTLMEKAVEVAVLDSLDEI
ncbi:MAG: pyroglutamyl-peptidase I [Conexivisphaerales archaeon]